MMEKEFDSGEFWLPADFLSDDFFAGEEKVNDVESDEDDPNISSLTHQLRTQSLLKSEAPKQSSLMATSPQSTLCGIGSWSFNSSNGSPEVPSTPFQNPRKDDALDLLYAAAGQVERLGLPNQRMGYSPNQDLIQQQLQAARFYQLKRQQLLKQRQRQQQINAVYGRQRSGIDGVRPQGLSISAWPPLQKQQQHNGAGMTAVFLNGGGRRPAGTGVFLPRRGGTPNEPRKKPACSTVLLPARVVQALHLNIEDMGVPHVGQNVNFVLDHEAVKGRRNMKKNYAAVVASSPSLEMRLPKEWTY